MSLERIQDIIVEQLGLTARPKPTTKLSDLATDSLDQLEIGMAIEKAFECKFTDSEKERVTDIASIVALVQKKTK